HRSQYFVGVGASRHREYKRHRRYRWPRPPLERVAPLGGTLCYIVLAGENFTVAAFDFDIALPPDIFEMGFDMASALLASRYLYHHLRRTAHNSRQLRPCCLAGG